MPGSLVAFSGLAGVKLTEKLLQGELLPSDDYSLGRKELEMMIETAKFFIQKTG